MSIFNQDQITARELILQTAYGAKEGHIGSALSIVDLLLVLYQRILHIKDINDLERDRFILSKGHAALALYVILYMSKKITQSDLASYCQNGSSLSAHPNKKQLGIGFTTGSLGQGVTMAVGAALAAKIQGSARRIFCLLSNAELNEGSSWEAIQFAAAQKLNNLVFILDDNGRQAMGESKKIIDLEPVDQKIEDFGWQATNLKKGHDYDDILQSFKRIIFNNQKPKFIVAHTTIGKGISFMEDSLEWHYKSLAKEELDRALEELSHA